MLHKSNFSIQTTIANRSEAMEADTISKHGRNLKSQTSREAIFKLAGILLVVCVLFAGCKKADDDSVISIDKITAKIDDASKFSDVKKVKITALYYENDSWVQASIAESDFKDGDFTINLPETVDTKYLYSLENLSKVVNVSNKNAKRSNTAQVWGVDSENKNIALFEYKKVSESYMTRMTWDYVDSDVNISGSSTSTPTENMELTITYSLKLKKGWNITYQIETITKQGDKTIQKTEYKNSAVSGLKWIGLLLY